jgi:dodecin
MVMTNTPLLDALLWRGQRFSAPTRAIHASTARSGNGSGTAPWSNPDQCNPDRCLWIGAAPHGRKQAPLTSQETLMAVAKIIEIISGSKLGFEDAIKQGVARASDTVSAVSGAWVKDQSVIVESGKIIEYRVVMKVTFMLKDSSRSAAKKK